MKLNSQIIAQWFIEYYYFENKSYPEGYNNREDSFIDQDINTKYTYFKSGIEAVEAHSR